MEQARYWMWTKRKHEELAHPTFGDSWEEQAFAEDAAGPLGGCVWPPRSYSCSFCRREFKSAQALGGHMNVHRRDRARLKQSPNPPAAAAAELLPPQNHHVLNPNYASLDVPQIRTYFYNRSSADSEQEVIITSPSSSTIRVSAPPTKIDCEDNTFVPRSISPLIIHENSSTNNSMSITAQSWSNLVVDKSFRVSDLKKNIDDKISTSKSISESNSRARSDDYAKADLSVSLNLFVCRTHTNASSEAEDEDAPSKKRRKIDAYNSFTLFPATDRCHRPHSEVIKLSPTSIEDLDLELRLGDPPKVK